MDFGIASSRAPRPSSQNERGLDLFHVPRAILSPVVCVDEMKRKVGAKFSQIGGFFFVVGQSTYSGTSIHQPPVSGIVVVDMGY